MTLSTATILASTLRKGMYARYSRSHSWSRALTDLWHSLIRDGTALPFTAYAAPPTVTMPRVKGLTTGSVPSFVDLILNFAESDTSSSLASQDTWLAQIKNHLHGESREGRLVFFGDDTWLKLFPDFFTKHDGTSSFFVSVSLSSSSLVVTFHFSSATPHVVLHVDFMGYL